MARIGTFAGPTTPFGVPTDTVHPADNDITPDPAQAAADANKAAADALYEDLKNATRDRRP